MSFIKKMTGMVVINTDDDPESLQVLAKKSKKKRGDVEPIDKRKKKKPRQPEPYDNMADLTEDARTTDKKEVEYKKKPNCLDNVIFHEKLRIIYVLLLCLALGLMVPYILSYYFIHLPSPPEKGYCGLNITYRMECLPGTLPMNKEVCYQANCCYDLQMDDLYAPKCFHTIPADYNYIISNPPDKTIPKPEENSDELTPIMYSLGHENLTLDLEPLLKTTPDGQESWPLRVLIQRKGEEVVRIKIWNPQHVQEIDDDFEEDSPSQWSLDVSVSDAGNQFNVSVSRNETGEEIFNTVFGPLIYSRDYMEVTSRIPSNYLYGFGQRGNFELFPNLDQRQRWALYNFDDQEDDTITYSSHPFYMNFEDSGLMHGVYLHNEAPVELGVYPIPGVVFRALGGSLDFRIFAGPTPHDVSRQYMGMIGMPAMPPFWALGYHLCRTSSDPMEFESVFEGMASENLPYESDCIDARLTYPGSFTKLSESDEALATALKDSGRKFWLTQHPFLTPGSNAYVEAQNYDLLLKINSTFGVGNETDINYYGEVAGEAVGYLDFMSEDTLTWMSSDEDITELYSQADGIMLLQNSPVNEANVVYGLPVELFCNETYPEFCCPFYPLDFLPAGITNLDNHTLCSSLKHPSLPEDASLHFRTHNAYGRYHHQRTYEFKKSLNDNVRPLVTSQSTFTGSGGFGGHFGGNYQPNFVSQQKGLVHILQMGLYGVPFTGVPICGSTNNTDDHLKAEWCIRGHQVGAFLPFMMNHYEQDQMARNPPNFSSGFMKQVKYFIRQRYMLLPYIYDAFQKATTTGMPVVRPLFYEFPDDEDARGVNSQFMLGSGIMVTPVFASIGAGESVDTLGHFPPGCWYNFYTGAVVSHTSFGEEVILPTLLTDINVHLLGGAIIPMQGNLHEDFNTTEEFRLKPLLLMVALPCELETNDTSTITTTTEGSFTTTEEPVISLPVDNATAYGELYMDDGITPLEKNPPFHSLTFEANATSLTITRLSGAGPDLCSSDPAMESNPIGFTTIVNELRIFGVPEISNMKLEGVPVETFTQDMDTNAITVKDLNIDWCVRETTTITWELS